jgi:hypothetical protein
MPQNAACGAHIQALQAPATSLWSARLITNSAHPVVASRSVPAIARTFSVSATLLVVSSAVVIGPADGWRQGDDNGGRSNVLTQHNNNSRTGACGKEAILKPSNVSVTHG